MTFPRTNDSYTRRQHQGLPSPGGQVSEMVGRADQ
jgi:hypothetical protein